MSKLAVANIIFESTESNRIEYTGNNVIRVRANGGFQLPYGTTAQRASPETGLMRYNTDTGLVESYGTGGWLAFPDGNYVNAISDKATAGLVVANAAFASANNVAPQVTPSYNTANAAFNTANAAYASANNVAPQVTPAFNTANLAYLNSNGAYNVANAAYGAANNITPQIAPSYNTANSAYNTANVGYASINSNWTVTNTVYGVANAAYGYANTALQTSGGTITGTLSIVGDLVVSGNVKQISSNTLSISDPLIYLAGNNYVSDIVDIGFVANYVNATSVNVHTGLYRSSSTKEYYLFQGYDKEPINNYIDPTGNNIQPAILNSTVRTSNLILGTANAINWISAGFGVANAAYGAANNVSTQIAPSYNTANAAFNTANAAYNAANNVNLSAPFNVANAAYNQDNVVFGVANAAFAKANTSLANTDGVTFAGNLVSTGVTTLRKFPFYEATANIDFNYTINTGMNAFTPGPVTVNTGITVTVNPGSTWTVS